MSYRDMRNFTEIMRALHYPRNISMDNFRSPNFQLVAEIILWLVKRFEPLADLPAATDSEQDRIILIRSAVQLMFTKTNIRLNPKKLYQADGYAVKELLKPAQLLYQAMKQQTALHNVITDSVNDDSPDVDVFGKVDQSKILDVKEARLLASEITRKAANLSSHLAEETEFREVRKLALGQNLELRDMENAIRSATKAVDAEIQRVTEQNSRITADEANLDAKIEKKKAELERNRKRLATLEAVRPAYMDEFEDLEKELSEIYADYVKRYTTLSYLEMEYETHCRLTEEDSGFLKIDGVLPSNQHDVEENDEKDLSNQNLFRMESQKRNRMTDNLRLGSLGAEDDDDEDDEDVQEEDSDEDMSDEDEDEDEEDDEDSSSEMNLISEAQQGGKWKSSPFDSLARPSTGRGIRRPPSASQSPRNTAMHGSDPRGRSNIPQQQQPSRNKKVEAGDKPRDKTSKKPSKGQMVESDDDF